MQIFETKIPDVKIFQPDIYRDSRGYFAELYSGLIDGYSFIQENISHSKYGVLRGLHYQINNPQGKLVSVISGKIYDVVVDLRKSSPTFGQWIGEYLENDYLKLLWIPPGFAHGFVVVSETTTILYRVTAQYDPQYECSIIWNDSTINIEWPIENPILSKKDMNAISFLESKYYV